MDKVGIDNVLAQLRAASAMAGGSASAGTAPKAPSAVDFGQVLKTAVEQVNSAQLETNKLAKQFEMGDPNANLQDVMISLQKANISFQTMVQVRNKLVNAYQDIMNMQV
jgi:flagellar hook-basal body complex protein FliE